MSTIYQSKPKTNLLIARKNVLELLRKLEFGKDYLPENIEKIGDLILNYGEKVIPLILHEMERAKDELFLKKYEYLIEYIDNDSFIPHLISFLSKTKGNIKLRKTIIKILKFYNTDFSKPPLDKYLMEFNQEIKEIALEMIKHVSDDPEALIRLFEEFHYLETKDQVGIVTLLGNDSGSKNRFQLLRMLLRTGVHEVILESIGTLGRSKDPAAVGILNEALIYLPYKYHELIQRSLRKLSFSGVNSEPEAEGTDNITQIFAGYPMGYGDRHVLFVVAENSLYNILLFEMEEKWGISEHCRYHLGLEEHAMQEFVEEYVEEFVLKEVDRTYLLKIFTDAIRKNYSHNIEFPYVFPFLSVLLPPYFLKPNKYDPSRVRLRYSKELNKKELLENSDALWQKLDFLSWLTADDRFTDIIERWYKHYSKEEILWMDDLLTRKVIREIILPDLEFWKERFCVLADFMVNISENTELVPLAIAVEESMLKDIEVLESIPFIRKMIIESKNIICLDIGEEAT